MAWIKNENEATRRLFNDDLVDEPVEFTENSTAQVSAAVAEALCDHYDDIRPYEADTED